MMIYTELPVPRESYWTAIRALVHHYTCVAHFIFTGRRMGR